ncbi:hypothetical protein CEXT_492821 [Caerostris extrusa]|uniref:Uncharacterized protein n=1 Tax=Caerostris extrusa TaxID=172846 RepID=A0AAV4RV49_CAEEX|nr:hypothetical protein CEXT_492821 [Caerostris extrusa]
MFFRLFEIEVGMKSRCHLRPNLGFHNKLTLKETNKTKTRIKCSAKNSLKAATLFWPLFCASELLKEIALMHKTKDEEEEALLLNNFLQSLLRFLM